jgi:hypothetical protein
MLFMWDLRFSRQRVWRLEPCSLVGVDRCFGGVYCLHHQGNKIIMFCTFINIVNPCYWPFPIPGGYSLTLLYATPSSVSYIRQFLNHPIFVNVIHEARSLDPGFSPPTVLLLFRQPTTHWLIHPLFICLFIVTIKSVAMSAQLKNRG